MSLQVVEMPVSRVARWESARVFPNQTSGADARFPAMNGKSLADTQILVASRTELAVSVVGILVFILLVTQVSQEVGHILRWRSTSSSSST